MRLPPDVPAEVQIIQEGDHFVMRTLAGERPLYNFDQDQPGKSTCTRACAAAWPPLYAGGTEKPINQWSIILRSDGSRQWAFRGKPVYLHARDREGHATGDGAGGVWHLIPTFPAK